MKNVHWVREYEYSFGSIRRNLSTRLRHDSTFYFEYLLEDGNLLIGHNDGSETEQPNGVPHKKFSCIRQIEDLRDLPNEISHKEVLLKWENNTRIRCTIEEAKEYLK